MNYLYRGVSKELDSKLNGKLISKGNKEKLSINIGQPKIQIGQFIIGEAEENTVRLHHIESGLDNGCAISTTTSLKVAKEFATNQSSTDGYVYYINRNKLKEYGIKEIVFEDPLFFNEVEVSLIVEKCKEIPSEIIERKIEISSFYKFEK